MTENLQANVSSVQAENEASLLDFLLVLTKHKKKIIGLPILAGAIAVAISLSLPDEYTATLKIAPSKNAPTYNWLLNNDQLVEEVSKELKLTEHYGTKGRKATRKEMAKSFKVTLNAKDGYLDVNATDASPEFAAQLANRMGAVLQKNLYNMRLLDVSKQRYDLETRREMARTNKLKFDHQIKGGDLAPIIALFSPADRYSIISLAAIQAEATLQGQSTVAGSAGTGSDLMQSELVRIQDQLSNLQRLLADNLKKRASAVNAGLWIAAADALQQQAYWSALIERLDSRISLLKKQEHDELKMTLAEVPDEKSGPKRALIVLLSAIAALFSAVLWAFIAEAIVKSRENLASSALLGKIAAAWHAK
ncbi:Wzz/FepE/Etk N-terminal domain-containing protein [Chitinibacter sp. S2-10]|uniref:Wzz/FepE/Etk N-terminal domain-containing protein n=1 Tax=Chitinibacter sp. S2-10 TaxID=3373597 RepID=UPI00397781A6